MYKCTVVEVCHWYAAKFVKELQELCWWLPDLNLYLPGSLVSYKFSVHVIALFLFPFLCENVRHKLLVYKV